MSKHLFAGLLFAFALQGISDKAVAQNKYKLSVKEAVDLAFKNVVDIKNANLDYQIQVAKNKEITGQALPQLTASASLSKYIKLPLFLFPDASDIGIYNVLKKEDVRKGNGQQITTEPDFKFREVSFQQPWNVGLSGNLSQLLFQPDVFVGLKARKAALAYYQSTTDVVKEKIKDSAFRRYYAILITEKQLDFIKSGVQRLHKLYHDDSVLYVNGFAEKLDLDKVQVQLTNLKTTQTVLENTIALAYAGLKYSLGISQKDNVVLSESLTSEAIKANLLDDSFQYDDRKEIQLLEKTRALQELDVKRNQLGYIPTLSSFVSYGVTGMGPQFITNKSTTWFRNSVVGLNLNVPIFDGFQRKYKVQQSKLTLQKLDNTITNVKEVIDLQQTVAKESLKNSLLNLDAQERNVELAESVYNTTKKKFESGLGSSFEILQADNDWQTAQSNYFNGLYNAIIARIGYLSAIGKL